MLDDLEDDPVWKLGGQAGGRDGWDAPVWIAAIEAVLGVRTAALDESPGRLEVAAARDWLQEAVFLGDEETQML